MSLVVDFAYVIDCTGSMSTWIRQTKKDINKVVDTITRTYPHIQLRLGCVAYRDWSDGDKRLQKLQFTNNVDTFKDWVGDLAATGGGDDAEDVLGGLQCASTLNWSSDCRVLFHICDAPPHNKMYHNGVTDKWPDGYNGDKGGSADPHDYHKIVLRKLESKHIRLCIAKLNNSVSKMISVFQEYTSSIDLQVEERELTNVSDLLAAVVEVLTDAIMRVDITSLDSHDLSALTKVKTWNPLHTKKRQFQCYCGIDFGTDGTTFAIALPSGKIIMNERFASDLHSVNLKDRTNILLRPDPPHKVIAFGIAATNKYTSTKDKKSLYFERFKMSLYDQELSFKCSHRGPHNITDDPDEKCPGSSGDVSYLRAANGCLLPTHIVFQRALEHIKQSAMDTLKRCKLEIKRVMNVQWVLTVPAIWSNHAKSVMHTAALAAGIKKRGIDNHVLIATEPECASLIAREKIVLSAGTKYILLDLGGGTADIACHVAINATAVKQIYAPQGGPWGSSYIDVAYTRLLDNIFGKSLMDEFKKKSPNRWVEMKENFRIAKHKYDGKSPENIELHNAFVKYIEKMYNEGNNSDSDSDDEDEGIIGKKFISPFRYKDRTGCISYDGNLAITPNIMVWNGLFDEVTMPLMKKVDDLLGMNEMRGCKHILLVGGLSQSQYIKDKLRSNYSDRYTIHSVPRPILAVVRGAATYGLRPSSIAQWMAPETMGIQVRRPYDETKDWMLPESQKKMCKRQIVIDCGFSPLITKGTPIDPTAEPKIEWFKPWSGSGQKEVKIQLYSSLEKDPVHTSKEPEGEKVIKLPSDWKETDAFPVVYWDKGAEKKVYIAVRDWPEHEREINIQWKDPMSSIVKYRHPL